MTDYDTLELIWVIHNACSYFTLLSTTLTQSSCSLRLAAKHFALHSLTLLSTWITVAMVTHKRIQSEGVACVDNEPGTISAVLELCG